MPLGLEAATKNETWGDGSVREDAAGATQGDAVSKSKKTVGRASRDLREVVFGSGDGGA